MNKVSYGIIIIIIIIIIIVITIIITIIIIVIIIIIIIIIIIVIIVIRQSDSFRLSMVCHLSKLHTMMHHMRVCIICPSVGRFRQWRTRCECARKRLQFLKALSFKRN